MQACGACGEGCLIQCEQCGMFTCWGHRHNYGTHHAAAFKVGDVIPWNGARFQITAAYPNHRRWMYDGYLLPDSPRGHPQYAIGVWESDLQ